MAAIDIIVAPGQTNKSKYTYSANAIVYFASAKGANTFYAKAATTWGSGTLTLYATPDGTDTNKFSLGLTLTADGMLCIPAAFGPLSTSGILAILTGSTSPDITVWLR